MANGQVNKSLVNLNDECPTFVAQVSFNGLSDGDLAIHSNDKLRIVSDHGSWIHAKSIATGEEGFVPANFVAPENSLESFAWYFPDLNRCGSEQILSQQKPSTFLVRPGKGGRHAYTLSVKNLEETEHFIILKGNMNSKLFISVGAEFPSLQNLIQGYLDDQNGGKYGIKIRYPCPKPPPQLVDLSVKFRSNWEIGRDEVSIDIKTKLGSGTFGDVYKAYWKHHVIAVKILKNIDHQLFEKEVKPLKQLNHKNIITLYGYCTDPDQSFIVFEFALNGCLLDALRRGTTAFSLANTIHLITQISSGLNYLESRKVVHRDIAARNILLNEYNVPKITDFGLARIVESQYYCVNENKMPFRWCAIECFTKATFSTKSDVWAFAVLVVEMFTCGMNPYVNFKTSDEVFQYIRAGKRLEKPNEMPQKIYELLHLCWHKHSKERPSFQEIYIFFYNF